ncbi:MAG TPA: kelch repeat-containing protein, partial [Chitinophagaceae bacterium]|nr:kelch repeat-containing protein [Chitinophagaceae bacterium]
MEHMATKTKLHSPAFAEIFTRKSRKGTFMLCMLMFMTLIAYSQGTWTALTNLAPNNNQGVLFLLSDGTVLCKTGVGGTGATAYGNLYNRLTPNSSGSYVNGTWSSIAPMADDRRFYSSQILQDGRMYVCGGEYGTGGSLGEIYNPVTNTWSSIPAPGGFVSDANSEILEDGQILQAIVGGGSQTVKLYNPATNTFSAAANTIGSHNECTWHKLNDGSILMVPKNSTQSTRYFPATNTWANDGVIPVQLYSDFGSETGGAAMLPDGRIWFVGGKEKTAFYTPSGTSAAGTWTAGPDIPNQYGQADGPVSVLRDGKVLFTCSPKPFAGAGNVFNTPTRFYEFDPIANTYTLLTAPNGAANLPSNTCYQTNFVNLPNGQILYGLMGTN